MSLGLHRVLVSIALVSISGIGLWQARPESHRSPQDCPHPAGVTGPDGRAVVACLPWQAPGDSLARIEPLPAHQLILLGRPIDLNRASAEDLVALPRIGPVLARRIIKERERRGPYRSADDLTRVKGIGPKTVQRLRLLVTPR